MNARRKPRGSHTNAASLAELFKRNRLSSTRQRSKPRAAESTPTLVETMPTEGLTSVPVVVRLSSVSPEPVQWLWPGRIPLGKLTLFVGDPGIGKSFLTHDIAARISRGTSWPDAPDAPIAPAHVVLLTAEDGLADTVCPRISAMKGDLSKISVLRGVRRSGEPGEIPFSMEQDLPALERVIDARSARLVVIDPLSAYLGDADTYRDSEVRRILSPLAALAERRRLSIVGVMHVTKDSSRRAIYRTNGSIAFTAAARAVWVVGVDPAETGRQLVVPVKMNVAKPAPAIAYRIGDDLTLEWDTTPVQVDADTLLGEPRSCDRAGSVTEAERFLSDTLSPGPLRSTEVIRLAEQAGISKRTLHRAKGSLGVISRHVGQVRDADAYWAWELPHDGATQPEQGCQDCQPADVAILTNSDESPRAESCQDSDASE